MQASIFIAKVLGPCYFIVGIGMLLNRRYFQKVLEDYFKNAALVFFTGMAPLVFGLVIVILHNTWVANWTVLITIFGWAGIIKGVWLMLFPGSMAKMIEAYIKNPSLLMAHSVLAVVLGLFLSYMGYFVA